MNLNITLVGDQEVIARFEAMPGKVHDALLAKVSILARALDAKVKADKLSGQVLNVRTGNLRRSIHDTVRDAGSKITGQVGSGGDVKYAAIHEFGGKTAAHEILPVKAQALSFIVGGKQVFAKKVNHPGSNIPMRSYLRSSLAEMREEIVSEMTRTVRAAMT